MKVAKQNQKKTKTYKLPAHNVFIYNIFNVIYFQNTSIQNKKDYISSTTNTNNNSVVSINLNSFFKNKQNQKTIIYNQKMNSFKKNDRLNISIGAKINLYKKKINKEKNEKENPLTSFSQNTSQYIKYKYLNPHNNFNLQDKTYINKTNYNKATSNKNNNYIGIITSNKMNKLQRNNCNNKNKNHQIKSINTNNYIINTFNLSEKNYINSNTQTQKSLQRNFTEELTKFNKEKEALKQANQKHSKLIEKLIEDNKNLNEKINTIQEENAKLKQRIKNYKENQDQLVMLVKIIQNSGVDIENIINAWNNEVEEEEKEEEEEEDNNDEKISKSMTVDSMNDLNGKIDCSSFIPIIMKEKKPENVLKVTGIPKLNFDVIKNKQQEKNNLKKKHNKNKKKVFDNNLNNSK